MACVWCTSNPIEHQVVYQSCDGGLLPLTPLTLHGNPCKDKYGIDLTLLSKCSWYT